MKIILATDSLVLPLTGIGKYTYELAKKYISDPRISDIRLFNMGRWQDDADFRKFGNDMELGSFDPKIWGKSFAFLRKTLSGNKLALKFYSRVTPYLYQRKLKPFSTDYIFHSPNYVLPPFSGKKVVSFHDLSILKYPEFHPELRVSYLQPEVIRAAEKADHIITDSEAVRQEVIEYFSRSAEDVTAIPLASSLSHQVPDSALLNHYLTGRQLRKGQFLLFVSSIEPRKNLDRILDAYESLPPKFKMRYPLVLTGPSGWKSAAILERINSLSNSGWLRYLGYISESELNCLYRSAGALVYPSIYEGFGIPIIEAQSMGVPVLTSNVSCMPKVSGGAALLADPYDTDSISHALQQIMQDEKLRQNLKIGGLKNSDQYSWARTVTETLGLFSRL